MEFVCVKIVFFRSTIELSIQQLLLNFYSLGLPFRVLLSNFTNLVFIFSFRIRIFLSPIVEPNILHVLNLQFIYKLAALLPYSIVPYLNNILPSHIRVNSLHLILLNQMHPLSPLIRPSELPFINRGKFVCDPILLW